MQISLPLHSSTEDFPISGPHRFVSIHGRTGLNVQSFLTRATLETTLHRAPQGTLGIWLCPLEDWGTVPPVGHVTAKDPNALLFPLVSDTLPARDFEGATFGLFWSAGWYPKLVAKWCYGAVFPQMDFIRAPMVYAEHLPLRRGGWYFVAATWNRETGKLALYVNGRLLGQNDRAEHFLEGRGQLEIGNPAFVMRDFSLGDEELSPQHVRALYEAQKPPQNAEIDADLDIWSAPHALPPLEMTRDEDWREAFSCSFTQKNDLEGWERQGPQYQALPRLEITSEGLLVQTPDDLATDTRTYLWSPRAFEGDQWLEFEFRTESPGGLALLVMCASGTQREDFIFDHGLPKPGAMDTIISDRIRNYHWEFFRRVEAMREDYETQVVTKNPFRRPLAYGVIPRLEMGKWHRLRFVKSGARLHGSLNGETVFDATDSAFDGHGPIYDFGRFALRQMYHTTLRYRNLRLWCRPNLPQ